MTGTAEKRYTKKRVIVITEMPTFDEVSRALDALHSESVPAEMHGLMTALICAGRKIDGTALINPIIGENGKNPQQTETERQCLLDLYGITYHKLQDFEFDFHLLLPDDDEPLSVRAEALSQWCQGFMTGFKLIGITSNDVFSEDAQDAFKRFMDIATLDHEMIAVSEDDENALLEVSEYVRLSILMIYGELNSEDNHGKVNH